MFVLTCQINIPHNIVSYLEYSNIPTNGCSGWILIPRKITCVCANLSNKYTSQYCVSFRVQQHTTGVLKFVVYQGVSVQTKRCYPVNLFVGDKIICIFCWEVTFITGEGLEVIWLVDQLVSVQSLQRNEIVFKLDPTPIPKNFYAISQCDTNVYL